MKKHWFGLLALLLLAGGSCKKATLPGFTNFEVEDTRTVVLPAGQVRVLAPISISSNAPAAYAANRTDSDHVQNVKVVSASLAITDTAGQTFDALSGAKVDIMGLNSPDQFEVGSSGPVAAGATTIALTPGATPIDFFVRERSYYLLVRLEPGQVLQKDTQLRVTLKYNVYARFKD